MVFLMLCAWPLEISFYLPSDQEAGRPWKREIKREKEKGIRTANEGEMERVEWRTRERREGSGWSPNASQLPESEIETELSNTIHCWSRSTPTLRHTPTQLTLTHPHTFTTHWHSGLDNYLFLLNISECSLFFSAYVSSTRSWWLCWFVCLCWSHASLCQP